MSKSRKPRKQYARGTFYVARDAWVRHIAQRTDLTHAEKLIAIYVIMNTNEITTYVRSQGRIATDLGFAKGTVRNALAKLQKLGLMDSTRQKMTSGKFINAYEFILPPELVMSLGSDMQDVIVE